MITAAQIKLLASAYAENQTANEYWHGVVAALAATWSITTHDVIHQCNLANRGWTSGGWREGMPEYDAEPEDLWRGLDQLLIDRAVAS